MSATLRRITLHAGIALLTLLVGCGLRVAPPASLHEPCTIAIVDYGVHAGLLLPRDAGRSVEYAYGNWEYFALGYTDRWTALRTVLPARGTLGRTELALGVSEAAARAAAEPDRAAIHLTVERAAAMQLLSELDRRFERNIAHVHENVEVGMTFVPDERDYWAADNCNGELARWLRRLECDVRGLALVAQFDIVAAGAAVGCTAP